jgi:hypothetical protein
VEPKSRRKKSKDSGWKEIKGGQAFVVPVALLNHENFARLSPHACKLLLDLGRQFNPKANGYLHAGIKLMRQYGWKSAHTLQSARDELEHYGIIVKTVQGGKNSPSYYGFTFRSITERRERPFNQVLPVMQPSNNWERTTGAFAPGNNKSHVLREHKASAASAQARREFVQPVHKETLTCAVDAQVSANSDTGLCTQSTVMHVCHSSGAGGASAVADVDASEAAESTLACDARLRVAL